jgi:hypothetical protein
MVPTCRDSAELASEFDADVANELALDDVEVLVVANELALDDIEVLVVANALALDDIEVLVV